MANPSGRTYHFGEHNPLAEAGGPYGVYKEGYEPGGRSAEESSGLLGMAGGVVASHPCLTFFGAMTLGFLTGWCVAGE
jgi:hypothetical protein